MTSGTSLAGEAALSRVPEHDEMSAPDDEGSVDLSVYLYRTMQQRLVSRETAFEFAKMLLADRFGPDEVQLQEPLSIHGENDIWVIRGSREPDWSDGHPIGLLRHGKAEVVISQFDGRILKLAVNAPLPPIDKPD